MKDRKISEPRVHYEKQASMMKSIVGDASIATVLDVGTEDVAYLDAVASQFACDAWGLNVQSGFDHYLGVLDGRIALYDGLHMPYGDK